MAKSNSKISKEKKAQLNSQIQPPSSEQLSRLEKLNATKAKAREIRFKRQKRDKIINYSIYTILILGGLFALYRFYIYPLGFHTITVNEFTGKDKGKKYATFSIRNGWISLPGVPEDKGTEIELFPSVEESDKAIDDIRNEKKDDIFWNFRSIFAQKLIDPRLTRIFTDQKAQDSYKANAKLSKTFNNWLTPNLPNTKKVFCEQYRKKDIYYLGCFFQNSEGKYYYSNLFTNTKYYDEDLKNLYKMMSTVKGDFSNKK